VVDFSVWGDSLVQGTRIVSIPIGISDDEQKTDQSVVISHGGAVVRAGCGGRDDTGHGGVLGG
jgi:hypothetical protein